MFKLDFPNISLYALFKTLYFLFLSKYFFLGIRTSVYFDVGNKNPKLVVDGHTYRMFKKYDHKTVWRCSQYFGTRSDRCKSRISTTGKNVIISSDVHNHEIFCKPDKYYENMQCSDVNIIREVYDEYKELFK